MVEFFTSFIFLIIGCILLRSIIIFFCVLYNEYRIFSKFNKLYNNAKDERSQRDFYIDFVKMDTSIPVNLLNLAIRLDKSISCDALLSSDMYYFLYKY